MTNLLSLLIWLPIAGGLAVLFGTGERNTAASKWLSLGIALATFGLCIPLWTGFDTTTAAMQYVEHANWIRLGNIEINYALGVDGFAMPLIALTSFTTVLVVLAGWEVIEKRVSHYMAAFLVMTGLMNGVFAATDAMLFYVFWEFMLIPMFLIIGIWGGPNRVYATLKFFLYTFLGSVLMLVALIYMGIKGGSFAIEAMHKLPLEMGPQTLIFIAFFLAFAVKVPMFPVHTWLPDAHVEAPTGGSVVLAAIMLKMGTYGFLRFNLPITPDASADLANIIIALSLIAVVYIGLVALVQKDMKKLIAYSSIAHMGFVTLGFFIVFKLVGANTHAALGFQGALVQMISHGFVSAALFLCVGVMYDRMHSRMIGDYGGVANSMPKFAAFFMLFAMANAGLPGTAGFVGEFMVIVAAFKANFWYAFLASVSLITGAAYTLWMYKRVVFGEVANKHVAELPDLNKREFLILAVLAVMTLALGLYPKALTTVMEPSVQHLIGCGVQSKLQTVVEGVCR
ncbi:MAG: NADH-quinone oxidoreductase subunit M [Gammaproteobacteria bacterium]|nr:NADH-quinone oxidoreductase subunit M [Gammaproteobacteria bacterium]